MKLFLLLTASLAIASADKGCGKKQDAQQVHKGRVEVSGICSNITIKVLDENVDTSLVQANWTDETTGIVYTNVFALGNPCSFSAGQGEEFYFVIDTARQKDCAVCMAYYPVPAKRLSIKKVDNP